MSQHPAAAQSHAQKVLEIQAIPVELRHELYAALTGRPLGIVINQARTLKESDIGKSMETVTQRYFGLAAKSLGFLNYDETVWRCVQNRRLLLQDFPHGNIAKRMREVAVMISQHILNFVTLSPAAHSLTQARNPLEQREDAQTYANPFAPSVESL